MCETRRGPKTLTSAWEKDVEGGTCRRVRRRGDGAHLVLLGSDGWRLSVGGGRGREIGEVVGVMGGLGDDQPNALNDPLVEMDVTSVDGSVAPAIDAMGGRSGAREEEMAMQTTSTML